MTPGRDIEPRLGQIPCLEEMLDRMIAVLPDKPDQAFRFLDLGGGAGTVSERLLTKFTETDCTLIEATEAERDQGGERLVTFGDRVTIIDGDFARVELPRDFDLVGPPGTIPWSRGYRAPGRLSSRLFRLVAWRAAAGRGPGSRPN